VGNGLLYRVGGGHTSCEISGDQLVRHQVIAHFALWPNSDGTIDYAGNGLTPSASSDIITAAHSHNVKVVVTVGGAGSESDFMGATSSSILPSFVSNIVDIVQTRGYDGVDIDWEAINSSDVSTYSS
jgi:GH18 family chitinase